MILFSGLAICRTAGPCDRHAGNVDRDDFAIVKSFKRELKPGVLGASSLSDILSDIGHFVKRIEVQFPLARLPAPLLPLSIMPAEFSDSALVNFPSFAPTNFHVRVRSSVGVSYSDAENFGGIFRRPFPRNGEIYQRNFPKLFSTHCSWKLRRDYSEANGKVFIKSRTYIFLSMRNIGRVCSQAKPRQARPPVRSFYACANRRVISALFKQYQASSCKFLRAFKVSYSTDGSGFRC